jgi:hypothetical protein
MTTMKGDQSRLNVAVNRLQSDHLSSGGSHSGKDACHGAPPPPPPCEHGKHKLRFLRYDGSADPVTWLNKAEQFFRAIARRTTSGCGLLPSTWKALPRTGTTA